MKIYLDVSCLNRPFDDQSQARIRLEAEAEAEAEAVTWILEQLDKENWEQVSSEMVDLEVAAIEDEERRRRVQALVQDADVFGKLTEAEFARAAELQKAGLKPADSVHVAVAERLGADVVLTVVVTTACAAEGNGWQNS